MSAWDPIAHTEVAAADVLDPEELDEWHQQRRAAVREGRRRIHVPRRDEDSAQDAYERWLDEIGERL